MSAKMVCQGGRCLWLILLISIIQACSAETVSLPPPPSSTPVPPTATATPHPTFSPTATQTQTPLPSLTTTASPTATPPPPSPTPTIQPTEATCQIEHIVIISVDGLRPDALAQADTPILDNLRQQGAYTAQAQAVLPSVTLINHASMLGGMVPDKHGITWNTNDTGLGKITGPTLFSVAQENGLRSAMIVGKPKLEDLVLPDSVDPYIYAGFTDRQVTNVALETIETDLPDILFIHLPDVDSTGHAAGWMSAAQLLVVGLTDGLIGELMTALDTTGQLDQTLIIITADHGGTGKTHGSDAPEDTTIPWLAIGPGVPAGYEIQQPVQIYDTAATAAAALKLPLPEKWDGQPVAEILADQPCP